MSGKVVRSTMPALNDGCVEAVENKEKATMCVKVFQEVHNSASLGDEGFRMRKEMSVKKVIPIMYSSLSKSVGMQ